MKIIELDISSFDESESVLLATFKKDSLALSLVPLRKDKEIRNKFIEISFQAQIYSYSPSQVVVADVEVVMPL